MERQLRIAAAVPVCEVLSSAQHRMIAAKSDQKFAELIDVRKLLPVFPVDPGQRIILTVSVVIAVLRVPELVAGKQHRCPAAQEKQRKGVLDPSVTQSFDFRVIRRAFHSAVPAAVVAVAVAACFTIGIIVLLIVGDQIIQREAVVAGHEIDGRGLLSVLVHVGRTLDAVNELRPRGRITPDKISDAVPKMAVPLSPLIRSREGTDLVESGSVPCLRNQLSLGQNRVVSKGFQKRRALHRLSVLIARENRGLIKSEAVHMIIDHPVAQAVQDMLANNDVVAVHGIAAAGVVHVAALFVQVIIGAVIDAFITEDRTVIAHLRRVVEDDVQNYLNPVLVQLLDHVLHLVRCHPVCSRIGIG